MFRPEDIILGWLVNLHIFLSVIAIIVFTPCSENLSEAEFYSFKNDLVSMELPAMNLATAYRLKKSFQVFFFLQSLNFLRQTSTSTSAFKTVTIKTAICFVRMFLQYL